MNFLIHYPAVAFSLPLVIVLTMRWSFVPSDRERSKWLLVAAALAVPVSAVAGAIADSLSSLRPLKYDLYVYRIDQIFGEPSFLLGSIVYHHPAVLAAVDFIYGTLPLMMFAVFALYLYQRTDALMVAKVFILNLLAAVPLYLMLPVSGPGFAFAHFPQLPNAVTAHPVAVHAAPNGVPSVHTSTAILILFFLWPWKWGRVLGVLYLALMMFATMGSGQHYFFDLLCAVPYACMVVYLARRAHNSPVLLSDQVEAHPAGLLL